MGALHVSPLVRFGTVARKQFAMLLTGSTSDSKFDQWPMDSYSCNKWAALFTGSFFGQVGNLRVDQHTKLPDVRFTSPLCDAKTAALDERAGGQHVCAYLMELKCRK